MTRLPHGAPPTDDELLELMRDVAARERGARDTVEDALDDPANAEPEGDACPHCAAAALDLGACSVCDLPGCLPRDDWRPGWSDPCLTRCARCGQEMHLNCGYRDEVGNIVCCGPRAADDYEGYVDER